MTKFYLIIFCIVSILFLNGCNKILEPVSLFNSKQDLEEVSTQEDFVINIKGLTFITANNANKASYSRKVMLTGSGSKANVLNEEDYLKSNPPETADKVDYLLGPGDQLLLTQLMEFDPKIAQWPIASEKTEYLLGAGDELTFVQSIDTTSDTNENFIDNTQYLSDVAPGLVKTKGVIGSNGNILLFGLGNIQAANRKLDDVRTEVRNILIRNGLAPNFQLEISDFQSQKVFITTNTGTTKTISLNNLPVSLKEIALSLGLSESDKNFALIKLTRNAQKFRMTAEQLFDLTAPEIFIQNKDQIVIQFLAEKQIENTFTVGLKGNVLIPSIARIQAMNKTIDNVYEQINNILIGKGIKPKFQLELIKAVSKKAFLIQGDKSTKVIPLDTSKVTLREFILKNKSSMVFTDGLSIITLKRNGQVFRMTGDYILGPNTPDILVLNNDLIEVKKLTYKPGQVYALGGAGKAKIVPINPSIRETLADVMFKPNGALNNLLAKRSEVYLLRGQNPSVAYHLDAQNVSRILVAAKTELRPNDIIYVADRPIISFSRTLSEILPLRRLLRDIQNNDIP